jgi:GNAT superfamily N-acetyltransferase
MSATSTSRSRSYQGGDETRIAAILNACHAKAWGNESFWRWKHSLRPDFSPDDVTVSVVDGEIVGCFHGAILPVRLEDGLDVPMCVEGDFAVLPEYRKMGLPLEAHDLADKRLLEAGVILRGGFTSQALNERFYHRQFGYIFAPTETVRFVKILGLDPLQEKVTQFSERLLKNEVLSEVFKEIHLIVDVAIDQLPPAHLEMSEKSLVLVPGVAHAPHMRVRIPYGLLVHARRGRLTLFLALLRGMLSGRVQVKGLLLNLSPLCRLIVRLVRRRKLI